MDMPAPDKIAKLVAERAMEAMRSRDVPWTLAVERLILIACVETTLHVGAGRAADLLRAAAADIDRGALTILGADPAKRH